MTAEGEVEVDENTGLSARLHGADFPNDQLQILGESLQAGTSALAATIDIKVLPDVEAKLKAAGATTVSDEMGDEIMGEVIAEELAKRQESAGLDERTRRARDRAKRFSH